jgi:putative membrane-bound dehydrogenase-like protein
VKPLVLLFSLCACLHAERIPLFDGKTLDGWVVPAGDEKWWRVQDGMITGGLLEEKLPYNTFISSAKEYANFDLRFKVRLVKGEGFINSGMQVRSTRAGKSAMSGYQVDAGIGYWGDLYDEHRRNKKIAGALDPAALAAVAKDWDWNEYRILGEGPRIRSWINGVAALDFTEQDPKIPLSGLLGMQAHGGGKFLVQFKDITLEELTAPALLSDPRSPETEKASFKVPDGYELELVASEKEGVGKPITVAWDHAGRMWTMTALEYPVDANENAAAAEALYQRGGSDKVLVFDEPWKPGPQTPRTFAEGLAIPLGILPWKDGALALYGHEIRYYEDRNKDGKADTHTTLLEGFGVQDSHLFPHQFERSPGGWFLLAQGLFNYSKVTRPGGLPFADGSLEKPFNQCKLARAKFDGSAFELLTAGPNNIWGFATARDGTQFLQEANDMGHPVSEFIAGTHYPTGSREKLRPYAPQLPASTPGQPMGGTGLSGIALADDVDSPFAAKWKDEKVFYLANPITNRIQIVTRATDGSYHKREDFLTTSDDWFRPVAVHFGPDGCLYIVDWCNKIISHNEVPRTHPDRDKTRGRIWRLKPKGSTPAAMPDLTRLPAADLPGMLGHASSRIARMTWEEIGDRKDRTLLPALEKLAGDSSQPLAKRLGALWAIQEMAMFEPALLARLAHDPDANVRREAIDAAGDLPLAEADFLALARDDEADFQVRCALANALRRQTKATPAMAARIALLAGAPMPGNGREAYDRNFTRYLVRWALETHPAATAGALENSASLPIESRLLAVLALPADQAAPALLRLLPAVPRPLVAEEAALLGSQLSQPDVARAFGELLDDPARREALLKALLQLDPAAASDASLRSMVGKATAEMAESTPATLPLALELARRFRLEEIAPLIARQAKAAKTPAELAAALRTLNEMQAADSTLAASLLDHPDSAVAREAMSGFAASGGAAAVETIAKRWDALPGAMRQFAVNGMFSNKASAEAFAAGISAGSFKGFDPSVIEKLSSALGSTHPAYQKVLGKVAGLMMPSLRFPGTRGASVASGIDLPGPFTAETWIKLDEGIDNRDSLLGRRGKGADFNFAGARLRFYDGKGDVVIADRMVSAGLWTHCAVTRDPSGKVALYLDGEPAGVSPGTFSEPLRQLDVGKANAPGGTAARFIEFRVWDRALSARQIQESFHTRFTGEVPGLVHHLTGDKPGLPLKNGALVEWAADFPELLTPEAAQALVAKFERIRGHTRKPGDPAAGRQLFQATCMICHQVRGEGTAFGPDLSGAGAMGTESLLRNIITPNAQLESGYYRHDISLKDGSFASGFLASENAEAVILRQIGADDRAIPRSNIKEHAISTRSLMPEGLIENFPEQQVADLFAYLMTLK